MCNFILFFFSFVLIQKKQKIKATSFLATNYFISAKIFELATLKQQIFFNARIRNLLTQKDEAAFASLKINILETMLFLLNYLATFNGLYPIYGTCFS